MESTHIRMRSTSRVLYSQWSHRDCLNPITALKVEMSLGGGPTG
jgi:hypothetical protein